MMISFYISGCLGRQHSCSSSSFDQRRTRPALKQYTVSVCMYLNNGIVNLHLTGCLGLSYRFQNWLVDFLPYHLHLWMLMKTTLSLASSFDQWRIRAFLLLNYSSTCSMQSEDILKDTVMWRWSCMYLLSFELREALTCRWGFEAVLSGCTVCDYCTETEDQVFCSLSLLMKSQSYICEYL